MSTVESRRRAVLSAPGQRPALLVVDVQRSFGDPEHLDGYGLDAADLRRLDTAIARMVELVEIARRSGVPVIWIELASDPDRPWKASHWLRGGDPEVSVGYDEPCLIGTPGAEWYRLEPLPGEARVVKRGYSGFLGTGLQELLRSIGVTWVTVIGLTTECCVDATATDAFQLDWPVVVPSDATAAYQLALHESALETLSLNAADVMTGDELIALWSAGGVT